MLLTAGGSNEKSFLLYPRTKGLIERHVTELGFDFLGIFRPNLLLFDKNDGRPNERWG